MKKSETPESETMDEYYTRTNINNFTALKESIIKEFLKFARTKDISLAEPYDREDMLIRLEEVEETEIIDEYLEVKT